MSVEIVQFNSRRRGREFVPAAETLEIVQSLPKTSKEYRARKVFGDSKDAYHVARQVKHLVPQSIITVRPMETGEYELFACQK